MIQFVLGMILGAILGFMLMGMCVAAGTADKISEEYFRKVIEEENDGSIDKRRET